MRWSQRKLPSGLASFQSFYPVDWWPNVPLALLALWWRRIAVVLVVGTLIVLLGVLLGNEGSAFLGRTAREEYLAHKSMGSPTNNAVLDLSGYRVVTTNSSVDSSRATIGDGSVTQSGRVGVRSLSSAIRVGHIITTDRSAYLEAVRPEPQSWPTTRWSCAQIAEAAARQGFPNPALVASIAMAESGGRSDAMAVNPRERSVGVMQVNTKVHTAWSDECLRSLECSLAVAYRLSRGGMSWTPWSAFNEGKHEGRCS